VSPSAAPAPTEATAAPDRTARIARSAVLLAALAFAGLVLTVGWQLAIAAVYGTSAALDAFWIGAAIPSGIASVFHLGVLTLLFVVVFHMPQRDRAEKDRLAASVFNAVAVGTLTVCALLWIGAPWLVRWMGPGIAPENLPIATSTLRWLTVSLVVSAPLGAMAGILNAFERFGPFAWSRVLGLAVQIALLFLFAPALGIPALVVALNLGPAVMLLACTPSYRDVGLHWQPVIAFRGDEARAVLRMLVALVLLGLLSRGNQIVDRWFASQLGPGAVSALEYGWRFEIPVSQILAFSIALPSFAMMALHAGSQRLDEFRKTVGASVRLTALLVAPVIVFLVVMREPLAVLWFQRGAFSPEAAATVASLIPFLGVMFVCLGLGPVMVFGMLMLERKAILIGILTAELLLNALFCWLLAPRMGVRGISAATTSAMILSNVLLWTIFVREMGGFSGAAIAARALRTAVACAGAALALAGAHALVWGALPIEGAPAILLACAALGLPFLVLYAALCHVSGLVRIAFAGMRPRFQVTGEA
jgi:putative peptidoglycan lipid II flippase